MQVEFPPCQFELFQGAGLPCRAVGCEEPVVVLNIMCAKHWRRMRPATREKILNTYKPNRLPSKSHMLSVTRAVAELADADKLVSIKQRALFLI